MNRKLLSYVSVFAIVLANFLNLQTNVASAVLSAPAAVCSGANCTVTFTYAGDYYTWTAPSGITSVNFDVQGAQGTTYGSYSGGNGGRVTGALTVTPGNTYYFYVGGQAGYNGGGAGSTIAGGYGGGGSDIRTSANSSYADRLVVAGGGGGAGSRGVGGLGGGLTGGSATFRATAFGGTQSAGGAGGGSASPGGFGFGGAAEYCGGAGGGGGGWYGGGGGATDHPAYCDNDDDGGGGGSSYTSPTFVTSSPTHTQGYKTGNGQISITYLNSPAVTSFTTAQSTPTNTNSSITFSITFSQNVDTVANSDFSNAGTATGCNFSVNASSGTSFTLTVSSCSEGTLQPQVIANSVYGTVTSSNGPAANSLFSSTIVIDRTVPLINTVTAPINGTYKPADTPTFTVAFSESVTVTGTPRLVLTVGSNTEYANYVSQSDSRTALFRYTVASDISEFDTDGISISSTLDLNGGAIADLATNALSVLTFTAPNTSNVFVAQPPAVPTINSATAGSGFISVYFTAGTTYGSPITNYQYSTNDGGAWTTRSPVDTSTPLTISGLTNGTSYQVRIRAVSAVGNSDSSTSITATPNAVTVTGGSNISTTYGVSASSTSFSSTGGVAPHSYTLSSTIAGITISNGVVTASSTLNAGTYSLNVISTDSYLATGTKAITITVAKARQDTLTVTSSNSVFIGTPSSLYLSTSGGTDTGTVTYSVVAGGTAIGCSISGSQLSVNTSGTCKVVATKATTTNYLIAYSDTATINFAVYVTPQPVQTQSVPSQLPINGQNSLDLTEINTVPAVTGVFLVGSTYEINGTGFTGVTRVVIGGSEATISSSTSTKIVINSAGVMPGPLFIECSDGRIGPSPFYFFVP